MADPGDFPAVGTYVEAQPRSESFKGSWHAAEVLRVFHGDVLVAYLDLHDPAAGEDPLQEWLRARDVRPEPPADRPEGFPDAVLEKGDRCEFRYEGAWWDVLVQGAEEPAEGGGRLYSVKPVSFNEKHAARGPALRPPWVFKHGEWHWTYNSKTRKVERLGPPRDPPRRVQHSVLPKGTPLLEPEVHEQTERAAAARAPAPPAIDEDGYGPPTAKASSYAEGTERAGADGRTWVVVMNENGASVWSLPGQAGFFIERERRKLQERRDRKRKELRATAAAAAITKGTAAKGGAGRASGRVEEAGGVVSAMDPRPPPPPPPRKVGKAGKQVPPPRAPLGVDHDRALEAVHQVLTRLGEGALDAVAGDMLEPSAESDTGFEGVSAQGGDGAAGRGPYLVSHGARQIGTCQSALRGAQLRALFLACARALRDGPLADAAAEDGPPGVSSTLRGRVLGRRRQASRQRKHVRLALEAIADMAARPAAEARGDAAGAMEDGEASPYSQAIPA